jgi:hypothetical protein
MQEILILLQGRAVRTSLIATATTDFMVQTAVHVVLVRSILEIFVMRMQISLVEM